MAGLPLKVGIYNEPVGSGIGGSENVAAVLAEAMSERHEVDLLHRIPSLTARRLAENSGTSLGNVRLRYVGPEHDPAHSSANPVRRYRAARRLHSDLSEPYDVFVAIVHRTPPFCHSALGALIVLFPGMAAPYVSPRGGIAVGDALRRPAGFLYHGWEWKKRMESYRVKTAISAFSQLWARRRWGIDCEIVHPPVDVHFGRAKKENLILSVGRFALHGDGHTKSQPEMLAAFREMGGRGARGWEYVCAGGLRDTPQHRAYFEGLRASAAGSGAQVVANVERGRLKNLFERASIFWHASGYGHDESLDPVRAEHFGIATVEAMAAGCVPVVVRRGGQKEVVEHGVSGFLWETLEELKEYTDSLIKDDRRRARMSAAARQRAQLFSREAFVEKFLGLLRLDPGPDVAAALPDATQRT